MGGLLCLLSSPRYCTNICGQAGTANNDMFHVCSNRMTSIRVLCFWPIRAERRHCKARLTLALSADSYTAFSTAGRCGCGASRGNHEFSGPVPDVYFDFPVGGQVSPIQVTSIVRHFLWINMHSRHAKDYSEAVLQAVCGLGSNTWCFMSIGEEKISHCSWAFRRLWSLPFDIDVPIDLNCSVVQEAFRKHGCSPDWIGALTRTAENGLIEHPVMPDLSGLGVAVKCQTVTDATARPIGRMLIFEHDGFAPIPPELRRRTEVAQQQLSKLTERETQILDLVYEGFTNKAIGLRSRISEKTVEKHRSNIMQKLGIRNAVTLVRRVTEAKLFSDLVTDDQDAES